MDKHTENRALLIFYIIFLTAMIVFIALMIGLKDDSADRVAESAIAEAEPAE